MNQKLLCVGGGGHSRSVVDAVLKSGLYSEIGIINPEPPEILLPGTFYAGDDSMLEDLFKKGYENAFICVGSTGNTGVRRSIYENLKRIGFSMPIIADPSASVSDSSVIGEGVFIGKQAIVNANSKVGKCAIINSASVVEHDCVVGDFVHLSTGAVLCGNATIGNDTHIGVGSVVIQGVSIGENCLIGAASNCLKNIEAGVLAYGNPCVEIRER